jgi:hypothetical protein
MCAKLVGSINETSVSAVAKFVSEKPPQTLLRSRLEM